MNMSARSPYCVYLAQQSVPFLTHVLLVAICLPLALAKDVSAITTLFAIHAYLLLAMTVSHRVRLSLRQVIGIFLTSMMPFLLGGILHDKVLDNPGSAFVTVVLVQTLTFLYCRSHRELAKAPVSAFIGVVIVSTYLLVAAAAPIISPYGEAQIVGSQYDPWSSEFLLGTDNLGRDMLSRLIYGARNTVAIAIGITALAFLIGGVAGLFSAASGGWVDTFLGRVVDTLMAIPQLIFALLVLTLAGTSITTLVITISVLDSTRIYRLVRASAMNILVLDFVEAARLRGEGFLWIVGREVLPNIVAPLAVEFGIRFCFAFLFISSLSFLGVGIKPPTADWGSMVRDNATLISYGDVTPLLPAAAIGILAISVNLIVDWFLHKTSGLKQ
jgi:peptide/nickel transport system permease protein